MKLIQKTPGYEDAFNNYLHRKPFEVSAMGESAVPPDGFPLPEKALQTYRAELSKSNILRQYASIVPTCGHARIKCLQQNSSAAFVPENGEIPMFDGGLFSFDIRQNKIASFTKVSSEMLRSSGFDLMTALCLEMGREIAYVEEEACISGSGIDEPWGLLHGEYGAEKGCTTTGSTLTFDDIQKLYFSLDRRFRRHAVWLMSDETALFLRQLKDSVGQHVWNDFDHTIFGKAVITSPHMPSISAGNMPVLFGDLSYYWLLERGDLSVQALHELYAASEGAVGFIATHFVDGRLIRREAVKALQVAE